ncbi:MAG: hypothetical protein JWM47_4532 [Acidimicrobiales bacterium]|nr:hypothetical protein [Acidimicrobiales bacterium]
MAATMNASEGTQREVLGGVTAAAASLVEIAAAVADLDANTDGIENKLDQVHTDLVAAETARNADDDALRTLVSDRLVASILTDPVVTASNAVRDRLPAALDGAGRLKVGTELDLSPLATAARQDAAKARLDLLAADASLQDLLSRVGPTASDTLLSLLRQVVTNTATEAAKVTHLDLTADTLNLSTDNLEGLLTTLNALVASESTLTALKAANHTDLVALATAFATLNAKDFATQTTAAAILAALPASLSSGRLKTEASPAAGSVFSIESSSASKGNGKLPVAGASTLLSAISGGIPSGATKALFRPDASMNFNDDGSAADANDYPLVGNVDWTYDGDRLSAVRFYGTGNVYVWFYA